MTFSRHVVDRPDGQRLDAADMPQFVGASSTPNPTCDTGDAAYSLQLTGTNPGASASQDVFGGFIGSETRVSERLEGTTLEGGFKCFTINYVVDFTGTRVGP